MLGSFLLGARPWMVTNTRVAASHVADRETLKDFVDGGVNYLHTLATLPEIMMFRDRLQTEGFWKFDSRFLMLLTPNGNILWHGKDPSAENKNVMAVEDSRGKKVVQELLAQAEGGGGFVDYHWDDPTQPDDPLHKLSYAASYTSAWSGNTLVLIGGLRTGSFQRLPPHGRFASPPTHGFRSGGPAKSTHLHRRVGQGFPESLHDGEL